MKLYYLQFCQCSDGPGVEVMKEQMLQFLHKTNKESIEAAQALGIFTYQIFEAALNSHTIIFGN
jgi:hypothetical protein